MPELPEVEAICRAIRPKIVRRRILEVRVARPGVLKPQAPAEFVALVVGRTVCNVRRRAKNVLVDLSGGRTIRIHLRMTGRLLVRQPGQATPADRVIFRLSGGRELVFHDQRALGAVNVLSFAQAAGLMRALGPEPLSAEFKVEDFIRQARRSHRPAKLFLMDQSRVAGLGNIYAAEALFRAGIDPRKPIGRIRRTRLEALHSAIVGVLRDAVQSTTTECAGPGRFAEVPVRRCVYGREGEPCGRCGRRIRRIKQGGRSTFFCPGCQR